MNPIRCMNVAQGSYGWVLDWWVDHPFEDGRRDTQHYIMNLDSSVPVMTPLMVRSYLKDEMERSAGCDPYWPSQMPDWLEKAAECISAAFDSQEVRRG